MIEIMISRVVKWAKYLMTYRVTNVIRKSGFYKRVYKMNHFTAK